MQKIILYFEPFDLNHNKDIIDIYRLRINSDIQFKIKENEKHLKTGDGKYFLKLEITGLTKTKFINDYLDLYLKYSRIKYQDWI